VLRAPELDTGLQENGAGGQNHPWITVLKLETSVVLPISINVPDSQIQVFVTACIRSLDITSTDTKILNPIFTGTFAGRGLLLIMGWHSRCPQASVNEGRVLTKTTQSSGSQTSLLHVLCAVRCQWLWGEVHFVMESKLSFSHKTPRR